MNVTTIKQDLLQQLEGRISSWEKMNKVVAHILKLKKLIIDVQLLQEVIDRIIKLVQVL